MIELSKINLSKDTAKASVPYDLNAVVQLIFLVLFLSGCSLEYSISDFSQNLKPIAEVQNRVAPDFIYGEVVTSGHYQMTAVFGEISEKTKAINNNQWEFEGVFYE